LRLSPHANQISTFCTNPDGREVISALRVRIRLGLPPTEYEQHKKEDLIQMAKKIFTLLAIMALLVTVACQKNETTTMDTAGTDTAATDTSMTAGTTEYGATDTSMTTGTDTMSTDTMGTMTDTMGTAGTTDTSATTVTSGTSATTTT
jgi:hypothetical protein